MRRALARGRLLPQSLSTDPRVGRLSLKAVALFPLMWINCDDQGRITGDPDEIKYAVCPNVEHVSRQDIPELLNELQAQEFILCYSTSKSRAIQMLDWWEEHKLQWAWPSRFSPPDGWTDHLRYKASAKEVVTENWPPLGLSGENSAERTGDGSGENPGERSQYPPLEPPLNKEERGKRKEEYHLRTQVRKCAPQTPSLLLLRRSRGPRPPHHLQKQIQKHLNICFQRLGEKDGKISSRRKSLRRPKPRLASSV